VDHVAPDLAPRIQLHGAARAILDFERTWRNRPGGKDRAIRERFGWSSTRYHQVLNGVIDLPSAVAYDPPLVRNLREVRERRRRVRLAAWRGSRR
jgi:hypothetical protein